MLNSATEPKVGRNTAAQFQQALALQQQGQRSTRAAL